MLCIKIISTFPSVLSSEEAISSTSWNLAAAITQNFTPSKFKLIVCVSLQNVYLCKRKEFFIKLEYNIFSTLVFFLFLNWKTIDWLNLADLCQISVFFVIYIHNIIAMYFFACKSTNRIATQPGRPGEPGKIREKSGNFSILSKILESQGIRKF